MVYFGERLCGKTKVLCKDLNPAWNEMFEVKVNDANYDKALIGIAGFINISLQIYHKDKFKSGDIIGGVFSFLTGAINGALCYEFKSV